MLLILDLPGNPLNGKFSCTVSISLSPAYVFLHRFKSCIRDLGLGLPDLRPPDKIPANCYACPNQRVRSTSGGNGLISVCEIALNPGHSPFATPSWHQNLLSRHEVFKCVFLSVSLLDPSHTLLAFWCANPRNLVLFAASKGVEHHHLDLQAFLLHKPWYL